jgi:hypothetical protein
MSYSYEENQALEWLDKVCRMISWELPEDCEGNAEQQIASAYINTQDSYAEGVVSIVDMPAFLRGHQLSEEALALLPPIPPTE